MRAFTTASAWLALALLAGSAGSAAAQNPTDPEGPPPAGKSKLEREPQEPVKPEAAKPPAAESAKLPTAVDNKTFSLGPEDVVYVRIWREPDLSGQFMIRPDGIINMPLIKEVQASGLTPEQLRDRIATMYSKYVNNPDVTVAVMSVRSKRYYVSGDGISRPGAFPLAVPTTVFDALTLAGGFREFANKKKILIIRGDKRIKFNYQDIVKGKNLDQNIFLENGDKIIVP
jgi:polysaccharide export outer membrane protein